MSVLAPEQKFTPSPEGKAARFAVLGLILAFVLTAPFIVGEENAPIAVRAIIFCIVGLSMNVLMGYAGQVSLGHAAFYGIGAFISGVVVTEVGLPFGAGLVVAGISGAVSAVLLGAVALRLKGLFLALVTIAYGSLAELTLFKVPLFKGGVGVAAPRPSGFEKTSSYYFIALFILAAALYIDWRLIGSKAGRAIQALRDDERVAASWGINVTQYKMLAFVISGTLAGIAGALFNHLFGGVAAVQFNFFLSLTFVLMTVVGGLGNRWGVIQGAIVFAILPDLLRVAHTSFKFFPFTVIDGQWERLIGALLLIFTLIFFPGGIAQQQADLLRWLSFGKFHDPDAEDGGPVASTGGESARP